MTPNDPDVMLTREDLFASIGDSLAQLGRLRALLSDDARSLPPIVAAQVLVGLADVGAQLQRLVLDVRDASSARAQT